MSSSFFNIRYVRASELQIFPTILSNEAMTSLLMKDKVGARFEKEQLLMFHNGVILGFWDFPDFDQARKIIIEKNLHKNRLPVYINFVKKQSERISKLLNVYHKKYPHTKNKKKLLWQTYHKACDLYRSLCTRAYVANLVDRLLTDTVRKELEPIVNDATDLQTSLLILTRAPEANYVYQHDLELIHMLLDTVVNDEALRQHVHTWRGLFNGMGNTNFDSAQKEVQQRVDQFLSMSKEILRAKQSEILSQFELARKDIADVEARLSLSRDMKNKFALVRSAIILKETRKLALTRFNFEIDELMSHLSLEVGISKNNLRYLFVSEIETILCHGNKDGMSDSMIELMKKDVVYVVRDGVPSRFHGKMFFEKINEFGLATEVSGTTTPFGTVQNTSRETKRVYSGMVSCRGVITAPIKIILSPKDFDKIQIGDILVTSLTTPEYVRLFDKVKGMITYDGGGLTSHPATLSREYKIPAILGVKELDGVLKDGDIVELDANNNKITIINKT